MQQNQHDKLTSLQLKQVSGGIEVSEIPTQGEVIETPKKPIFDSLTTSESVTMLPDIMS